jgi:hypothetical protein
MTVRGLVETTDIRLPILEQIAEVKRELSMRSHVYPNLVSRNKITQREANLRVMRLEAVLKTLLEIQSRERLS